MPVIYQGKCSKCDYRTPLTSHGYAAVLLDTPGDSQFTHEDDDRIVVLTHPGELLILKEIGHTAKSATLEGRYLLFTKYFCKSCGHLFEIRRLSSAGAILGCLPAVVLGIAAGIGGGIWNSSILLGLITACCVMLLLMGIIDFVVGVYIRAKYADRTRKLRTERCCPKCGSRKAAKPGSWFLRLPCPKCKERSVQVKRIAIS